MCIRDRDGAEECAVTATNFQVDASTSTEQGCVVLMNDEFQQLLHLVAAGIELAKSSKAQVGFCLSHAY